MTVSDSIAIHHAKQLGTLHALDRSRQYPLDDPEKLKKAVNEAWTKIHHCEKELILKDSAIAELEKRVSRYRVVNIALTSILTGLAWEGLRVFFSLLFS